MSVVLESANSEYLYIADPIVSSLPVSISAWVKLTADDVFPASICDSETNTDHRGIDIVVGGNAGAMSRDVINGTDASRTSGFSTGSWIHIVAVLASSTSRTGYVQGSGATENTQTNDPDSLDRFAIGCRYSSQVAKFCDGKVAEVAIWSYALGSSDVTSLYNSGSGTPATNVQSGSLVSYWKLIDDANDSVGSNNLSANGTVGWDSGDHPVTHPSGLDSDRMSFLNMAAGIDGATLHALFPADGTVAQIDRQHMLDCYAGINFGSPGAINLMNQLQFSNLGADLFDGTLI